MAAGWAKENAPAVHTGRGILVEHLVGADVHETQAAPGLDVFVAIAADVEGRTAVEATEAATVVAAMMTAVAAVHAMPAVATMTTVAAMTASRSRGHRGGTECEGGDNCEGNLAKHLYSPCEVQCTGYAHGTHPQRNAFMGFS
jgi:hypothetical protein